MTHIPDLFLDPFLNLVAESTFSPATLLPVLCSQWEIRGLGQLNSKLGSVQVCRVREQPKCVLWSRLSVLCTHREWVWISADPPHDRRLQGFPAGSGLLGAGKTCSEQSTWAADLSSWMRTESTTLASGSPFCIRSCCKCPSPLAPVLIHAWASKQESSDSPFTISAS